MCSGRGIVACVWWEGLSGVCGRRGLVAYRGRDLGNMWCEVLREYGGRCQEV